MEVKLSEAPVWTALGATSDATDLLNELHFPFAAIVYPAGSDAEGLLGRLVETLKRADVRIGGVISRFGDRLPNGKRSMMIVDVATGREIDITLRLGTESGACSLDTQGLASGASIIRQAIENEVDLIVINKFGEQEANGQGLRAEFIAALDAGIPTLTTVKESWRDALQEFSGGLCGLLPIDESAVERWCEQVLEFKPPRRV